EQHGGDGVGEQQAAAGEYGAEPPRERPHRRVTRGAPCQLVPCLCTDPRLQPLPPDGILREPQRPETDRFVLHLHSSNVGCPPSTLRNARRALNSSARDAPVRMFRISAISVWRQPSRSWSTTTVRCPSVSRASAPTSRSRTRPRSASRSGSSRSDARLNPSSGTAA